MAFKISEIFSLFFTFLSFSATTYTPPWTSSNMEFFAFLAVLSLFLSITPKSQRIIVTENFLFLFLILITSYIFLITQPIQQKEKIWMISLYGFFYIIYANSLKLKNYSFKLNLITTLLAAGIFNCFVILTQYFSLFESELGIWIAGYENSHGRPYGNFGQPNLAATLILTSLCCAIFLYKKNRISIQILIVITIFFGATLALPSSKTSFLCLAVLATITLWLRDKTSFMVFSLASIAVVFAKSITPSTRNLSGTDISTGRFELWRTMLDAIWQSPWLGYGVLNTRVAHFQSRELDLTPKGQVIGSSHNLILDFFVWFGVIAGLIISIYFLKVVFNYVKHNRIYSENIYLVLPIFIHSLLEYPLFYANFLFIFAFILNINSKNLITIKSKLIPYIFAFIGSVIFLLISTEYYNISQKFTELRFYNNKFLHASKPEKISLVALDITGGQYNLFLKEKIENDIDFNNVANLTKSTPSFKNFILIISYLRDNEKPQSEIDFWLGKARASFSETEIRLLETNKLNP